MYHAQVNGYMDPEGFANRDSFSIEFWSATLTITGITLLFVIAIVYACVHENAPARTFEC